MLIYVSIGLISVFWLAQLSLRQLSRTWSKRGWWIALIVLMAILVGMAWLQFTVWKSNDLTEKFLPPFAPLTYFLSYIFTHYAGSYILSGVLATILMAGMRALNKKNKGTFFERGEEWIAGSVVLLVGWPGIITYAVVMISAFVGAGAFVTIRRGKQERVSPYYFWLPVGIFAIILNMLVFQHMGIWNLLIL